jgi:DNA-binding protein HU-beta
MNKQDLVWEISKRVHVPQAQVETILEAAIESIMNALEKNKTVTLMGFGTFERKLRKARKGFDPHREKSIKIPQLNVAKFRAGKEFKERLNKA